MAAPKDVLAQLLSPAQAETLQAAGIAGWQGAIEAFTAFLGSTPAVAGIDGRLVMPDEIVGDFSEAHLVLPLELTTDRDESAMAYAVMPTLLAAMFFDSTADDESEQEQLTVVMASTFLNQVVRALNTALAAGSPNGLAIAAEDLAPNAMPALLGEMDEPALALTATVQGSRLLPFTLVLPGTFLDVLAGSVQPSAAQPKPAARPTAAKAAAPPPALDPSLGFTLSEDDLADAELIDDVQAREPHPDFAGVGAGRGSGREPRPIAQGPAANRARFAPLSEPPNPPQSRSGMDLLAGLRMNVTVELGRTTLTVSEVLGLGPGSVVELERLAGEPVDILINERLIAKGEVVVVDENFGIRVVEVVRRTAEHGDND